jgi:uncharacterized protein YjbI with pentapeptide repeats
MRAVQRAVSVNPAIPALGNLRAAGPADNFDTDKTIRGVEFRSCDFSDETGEGLEIYKCRFEDVRLPAGLSHTVIEGCHLITCDLATSQVDDSSLLECYVTSSRLTGMSWSRGIMRDSVMEAVRANLASFRSSKIRNVVFRECDLNQADFQSVELRNVLFDRCNLTAAQFSNAAMQHNVRFEDCKLIDIVGVQGMAGSTVSGGDLLGLAGSLARAAGIAVEW